MSAVAVEQTPTTADHIDRALSELTAAKSKLGALTLTERITLLEDCLQRCYLQRPRPRPRCRRRCP